MSTFIVADVGANHNRDFLMARNLIEMAAHAGCDAVKFQTYSSDTLYAKNTPDFSGYKNINKLIKDIELPRWWQRQLKQICDDNGVEFMSTPFDERAIDELVGLGVKRLKIAAFESSDPRFVRLCAKTKLPLIISLGIAPDGVTYQDRMDWVLQENRLFDLTFLHCNSAYPTRPDDLNLITIAHLQGFFEETIGRLQGASIRYGLSDHTMGTLAPALAVMFNISMVEFHITMSRSLEGPDHPFAREPAEVAEIVCNIRLAEQMYGKIAPRITNSEQANVKAMRSVVASRNIHCGELLTVENITTMRPYLENSIPAYQYFKVLQKPVNCDIKKGHVVTWNMIQKN